MTSLQKFFSLLLLTLSTAVLAMSIYLVDSREYSVDNLGVIIVFNIPVVMSIILSLSLLFKNK